MRFGKWWLSAYGILYRGSCVMLMSTGIFWLDALIEILKGPVIRSKGPVIS